jgi:hypothetical protein
MNLDTSQDTLKAAKPHPSTSSGGFTRFIEKTAGVLLMTRDLATRYQMVEKLNGVSVTRRRVSKCCQQVTCRPSGGIGYNAESQMLRDFAARHDNVCVCSAASATLT